ncbi:MAG: quinate 5-dehydrogenase [Candidatus Syntrophonatronum acetioxidans]|uniref:Quinate 5-dehydrogenase n=1 Tax=Candidatus Syntrophonatronum acetioxidans TaxID=1795816 RepID=A0A424YF20_9FIRM|nr:MAG: quinate 5-dehydrogenase [Candidatus Syntrophonatronum acetioxidans]
MKRVVSVSLGSSKRNHQVEIDVLGERFIIERLGTDGDMKAMVKMIRDLDGKVDAFGLGGMDLFIFAGTRRYILRDALKVASAAQVTPLVDGSGLKNTLERRVINYLRENTDLLSSQVRVLMVCAMDRFGMAQALVESGCKLILGDFVFVLGLPLPLYSLKSLEILARLAVPIVRNFPFEYLYPTGKKQEETTPRYGKYFHSADIIAGDFHFIRRYMPSRLEGKSIITNTVTSDDVELLKEKGVKYLVTTTPELKGRSFGTNVMEAMLVAVSGKKEELTSDEYNSLLSKIDFKPRVELLNK